MPTTGTGKGKKIQYRPSFRSLTDLGIAAIKEVFSDSRGSILPTDYICSNCVDYSLKRAKTRDVDSSSGSNRSRFVLLHEVFNESIASTSLDMTPKLETPAHVREMKAARIFGETPKKDKRSLRCTIVQRR